MQSSWDLWEDPFGEEIEILEQAILKIKIRAKMRDKIKIKIMEIRTKIKIWKTPNQIDL